MRVPGLNPGEDLETGWCGPVREAHLPKRPAGHPGEHLEGQGRPTQAAPLALDDVAEGVHRRAVQHEPRGLSRGLSRGSRHRDHPPHPRPLTGPAYFVSHGGEAFPSLIVVLQGYGITIDLVGSTFISKQGITSSTFKTVPDQPVGSFELTLPQGPFSALAANGNLCSVTNTVTVKKKVTVRVKGHKKPVTRKVKETIPAALQMPTAFTAQNGATIHQSTKITVTGCPKGKKAKKHKQKAKGNTKGKK
jgi:hypothetical protein